MQQLRGISSYTIHTLALYNNFLFPKLKIYLKNKRFGDMEYNNRNATVEFHMLSKKEFQRSFNKKKIH